MKYTDKEQLDWWKGLCESDREDVFARIMASNAEESFKDMAHSIKRRWESIQNITAKQIAVLRKWYR